MSLPRGDDYQATDGVYIYAGFAETARVGGADLQARTGQYSEKVAVVSLAAGLATLGLWAAGIIKGDQCSCHHLGRSIATHDLLKTC